MTMQRAWWRYSALVALVAVGVPEQLRKGPRTVAEIAAASGTHAPTLARLLRNIAQTGLVRGAGPATYELTPAGRALLGGVSKAGVLFNADREVYGALGELTETVRTGVAPFTPRHGSLYNYLSTKPELSAVFDALMDTQNLPLAEKVATLIAASDLPEGATLVDVGGAKGTFVAAILRANPALDGVLFDLERSAEAAQAYLEEVGVADRTQVVSGDFFKAVPAGDAYLLAHIVHNWADEQVVNILRTIRASIPADGRLLIVEAPIPDGDEPHFAKDLDIRLLTMHEGRERTVPEYEGLLGAAGFHLVSRDDLYRGENLITAVPVPPAVG
jgi:hypothetical protein